MLRLTFTGGTSAKFWEVERAGATVTVRFGRIGTDGQTQVKELASADAAEAHVAKLVAEKRKKGYADDGPDDGPGEAAVEEPAPVDEPVDEVAPSGDAAPAAVAGPEDEDRWVVPALWWRQAAPIRGLGPAVTATADPDASAAVDGLFVDASAELVKVLDATDCDDESIPDVLGAEVQARGEDPPRSSTPLGAALFAAFLSRSVRPRDRDRLAVIADDWVGREGVAFAVEAAVALGRMKLSPIPRPRQPQPTLVLTLDDTGPSSDTDPVLDRLRTLLAALDDDAYAAARDHAAATWTGVGSKQAAARLFPTEDWPHEVIAEAAAAGVSVTTRMLTALRRADDVATMLDDRTNRWFLGRWADVLPAVAAHVGPSVAPALMTVLDDGPGADVEKRIVAAVAQMPTDEAFDALVQRADTKRCGPALLDAGARHPHRAVRRLAAAVDAPTDAISPAARSAAREALVAAVQARPDVAAGVAPGLDGAGRRLVDETLARAATAAAVPRVALADLPPVLASPPWSTKAKRPKPVVLALAPDATPSTLAWQDGEQAAHADLHVYRYGRADITTVDELRQTLGRGWQEAQILSLTPTELAAPVLADIEPGRLYDVLPALQKILGRHGDAGVRYVVASARQNPASNAEAVLPISGAEVAELVVGWLARSKRARPVARRWLDRHPAAAAAHVLPVALGKPGAARRQAEAAIRALDQLGHRAVVEAAADADGAEARAAVDDLLATDPLEVLPARIPKPPAWLEGTPLPPVRVAGRDAALPDEAVAAIVTMFAISEEGAPYAGVEVVREVVDPASLAGLGWALHDAWLSAGAPAKDGWVVSALGLVGDDDTVRRLSPLIRAWPGEGAHKRAVAGLDVLAAIGTDVALMHLNGIADRVKFKGVKAAAREKIEEVAEGLGLTRDELADRLVPTFDLDDDGSLLLDYGPRRFRVGFDEQMRPTVADEDGTPRKSLPKPGAKDDPELAPAAEARFKGLKKDVRTVATDQVRRFEQAMVRQRRWTWGDARRLFVEHPLMGHLARRVVWATFDADDRPTGAFRVAEDRTLADVDDGEVTVVDDATVGIAHPLHLGDAVAPWSDLFADYEVLQPFAQLGREVLALTDEERAATRLDRHSGVVVPTGKVLGLTSGRGWERGSPMDGGVQVVLLRPAPGDLWVVADLDPGVVVGELDTFEEQTIDGVWVSPERVDWPDRKGGLPLGHLDPVTASEVLRDLESLIS